MRRQISPCHSLPGSLCSDSAASLTFQPANLLTCQRSSLPVTNPFICHRSAKSAAKSNPCHTSKNPLPQVQSLPHLPTPHPCHFKTGIALPPSYRSSGSPRFDVTCPLSTVDFLYFLTSF